jgi:hypothetical protein
MPEVGVRRPGASTGEANPKACRSLFHGSRCVTRLRDLPARLAFWWGSWVQKEGRELDGEVVCPLKPFDLDEADVAPRSDEVGEDEHGNRCGFAWLGRHGLSIGGWPCPENLLRRLPF